MQTYIIFVLMVTYACGSFRLGLRIRSVGVVVQSLGAVVGVVSLALGQPWSARMFWTSLFTWSLGMLWVGVIEGPKWSLLVHETGWPQILIGALDDDLIERLRSTPCPPQPAGVVAAEAALFLVMAGIVYLMGLIRLIAVGCVVGAITTVLLWLVSRKLTLASAAHQHEVLPVHRPVWGRWPDWWDPFSREMTFECPVCQDRVSAKARSLTAIAFEHDRIIATCPNCGLKIKGNQPIARIIQFPLTLIGLAPLVPAMVFMARSMQHGGIDGWTLAILAWCAVMWSGRLIFPLVFAAAIPFGGVQHTIDSAENDKL